MVRRRECELESAPAAPGQQDEAGDDEAESGEQQCRHFRSANADGGVGGSPEKVDAEKRQHNGGCAGGLKSHLAIGFNAAGLLLKGAHSDDSIVSSTGGMRWKAFECVVCF